MENKKFKYFISYVSQERIFSDVFEFDYLLNSEINFCKVLAFLRDLYGENLRIIFFKKLKS